MACSRCLGCPAALCNQVAHATLSRECLLLWSYAVFCYFNRTLKGAGVTWIKRNVASVIWG